CATLKVW
nr:immunoglobulin heavy chain junction region [Macaca mulatta]MOV53717.1 immunoglobulin heavy chain junction region [Macaca mulatta]MOV53895.1 immunoglobulin heavy chain junction region [Macaca mulatta]MOV54026.1 immunoglobulin heavy chain junction region [Macaca mulatta]MOV54611.1 immunoglobulin heavy chain junction region [Macaca mulatta]